MKYLLLLLFIISIISCDNRLERVLGKDFLEKMRTEQKSVYDCMVRESKLDVDDLQLRLLCNLCTKNHIKVPIKSRLTITQISAHDLYKEFIENDRSARSKYLGRIIIVEGILHEKYTDEYGAEVVILSSNQNTPVLVVTLKKDPKSNLSSYDVGDKIKIKGQCSGMLMEVTMNRGEII